MKRFVSFVLLALALVAATAHATVPSTISYQGVITDGAGNIVPDGPYNLTFKIYDVPVLGAALWTEVQVGVTVTKGGFAVNLGSVTPLTSLAFDKPYYLGIAVGANPEMTPRVTMAASPYGLSLRLPFTGVANGANPAFTIQNNSGAAVVADPSLEAGTATSNGTFVAYDNGATGFEVGPFATLGSFAHWRNSTFGYLGGLEPDSDGGNSGYFWVSGQNGGFTVDGNAGGTSDPFVYISGAGSSSYFDTNVSGDAAVGLPTDAVSSGEILDEPGIAQAHSTTSVNYTDAALTDVASVTITIPAAGYIVLAGDGQVNHSGTTASNYSYVQISETSPGSLDFSHYGFEGSATGYATTGSNFSLTHQQRTYYKASPGAYTFYFQLQKATANGTAYIWQPTLLATYYPTSYGAVTTIASGAEAGQFSSARPVVSDDTVDQPSAAGGVVVDLRELELRVQRERADFEAAQRQLAEARLAQQKQAREAAAKATKGGN
jgi:hypothetical protein